MLKKTILIIEDDVENAQRLSSVLHQAGYETCVAYDPAMAAEKINKQKLDLIILGYQLSFLSGFELCSILKTKSKTKEIPVVMLSELSTAEDVEKGYFAGADGYLVKPFKKEDLTNLVSSFINSD